MRTGLLGGTFDPIHLGHLAVARAALRCAQLDRVILMPAAVPPHRPAAIATADERLQMCRLAATSEPHLEVSEIETSRTGPSYTLDTLQLLRKQRPDDRLFMILGWDAARDIPSWHRPAEVLKLAELVLLNRPGLEPPTEADLRTAGLDPARVIVCPDPTPDVRATEIREIARGGGDLSSKVPEPVAAYIRERGLYRS